MLCNVSEILHLGQLCGIELFGVCSRDGIVFSFSCCFDIKNGLICFNRTIISFFETRFGVLIFCPDKPRKVVPRIVRIERKSFYIQLAYIASIYIRTNSIYIIAEIEPSSYDVPVLSGFNGVFAAVIPNWVH